MMKRALVLSATVVALLAGDAVAQRAASTKALGTAYDMWSSGVYFDHAYDHSAVLQNYAASAKRVPQGIAKRHAAGVRNNLKAAGRANDRLAKAYKDDETATGHLDTIKAHHAKALAMTEKLDTAYAEGHADPAAVHAASSGVAQSIQAARSEHEKLMKHLKVNKLNPDAKPAPSE